MNKYQVVYKTNNKIVGEKINNYNFETLENLKRFFYNMFIGDFKTETKLYNIDNLEKIDIMKINEIIKRLGINLNHIEIIINENYYKIYNKNDNSLKELKINK